MQNTESSPLSTSFQNRLAQWDALRLSDRYLFYGLLLGAFRIFWEVGRSSGLFGQPPDAWIHDVADWLKIGMFIYTLLGLIFFVEVVQRLNSTRNLPVAPLIMNVVGVALMWAFSARVAYVMDTDPRTFQTWGGWIADGVIQGGVYALIALGYTLVYGILLMINFAHGEVMMFGAYAGFFATQYIISGGNRSFEDGSAILASFIVPLSIGFIFLPIETLLKGYQERKETDFQSQQWMFTFFSLPVRFLIGIAVGYGALVGLGGYAPHIYLLVLTIIGMLFVMVVGMAFSTFLAFLLERIAYRPLRRAPRLAPLISAIGASIFLQQVALRVFGPNRKGFPKPRLLSEPATFNIDMNDLGTLAIPKVGVLIVIASVLLMTLLYVIVQRTKVGKAMRAVAQDKSTAALMGINVDRVIVFTFMLGASLAGAAGVMLGFRGEDVDFRFGFTPGLKAFTAAVLGGIGNIPGAMFGGFFLGIVEALGPGLLGVDFEWRNAIAFGLLVLVLIFRPTGILGERVEAKKV